MSALPFIEPPDWDCCTTCMRGSCPGPWSPDCDGFEAFAAEVERGEELARMEAEARA